MVENVSSAGDPDRRQRRLRWALIGCVGVTLAVVLTVLIVGNDATVGLPIFVLIFPAFVASIAPYLADIGANQNLGTKSRLAWQGAILYVPAVALAYWAKHVRE